MKMQRFVRELKNITKILNIYIAQNKKRYAEKKKCE